MKTYLHLAIHDLRDHESLSSRQISARLGIPRSTVIRHLSQPRQPAPRRTKGSGGKLAPYRGLVSQLVSEGLNAAQIFNRLTAVGYSGGVTLVRSLVREIRPAKREAFLTMKFAPGEMAQVDFATCGLVNVDGERRKQHAFLMVLGHSRRLFVRFIMRENTEH
ncbi:MAG: transposase [Chloroflexi bacterium]|nr:transposase [Chloroflexota bacterium]